MLDLPAYSMSACLLSVQRHSPAAGVDLLIDVHADEELPYVFIAGSEGIPGFSDRLKLLQESFSTAFRRATPDFQTRCGYETDAPGAANLSICSNQVNNKEKKKTFVYVVLVLVLVPGC